MEALAHIPSLPPSPPSFLPLPPSLLPPPRCAICMMDYCAGEPIRLLPCMHYYHLHCIDDWLMRSLTCPTCMERVDAGLMTTISTSGTGGTSWGGGGRRGGFSLRRRHRGRGQGGQGSVNEAPLVSGNVSSCSSSRSSSTSSSTEHLINSGGHILWPTSQGVPQNSQQQQQQLQGVISSNSGTIFLPPFPSQNPTPTPQSPAQNSNITSQNSYTDLGPLPRVMSPPSSPTQLVLVRSSPPNSPLLPNVTIHTVPTRLTNQLPTN